MANGRLPHFVIIGAVKGATTWIHNQLQDNPAIYLPAPEPHFFSQEHAQGLDHYRRFFDGARPDQILGEKSADYLAHPDAPPALPLPCQRRGWWCSFAIRSTAPIPITRCCSGGVR